MSESPWPELARKRRGMKVLTNPKYKKGGAVAGETCKPSLGKNTRGAEKTQDEQKTVWDGYKKGGWIKSAIKHPGAEKKAAVKAGKSTHEYMEEHKNDSGTSGKRARLGLTLSNMSNKK